MLVARCSVVLIAIIAMFIAKDPDSKDCEIVSFAWAGFGATFGPLMLFSLFWKRVNRGGAWHGYAGSWRVARRNGNDPGERNDSLGFRIVLTQTTRKVDMVEWLKETFD